MYKYLFLFVFCQSAFTFNLIYKEPGYSTNFTKREAAEIDKILRKFEWPNSVDLFTDPQGKIVNRANIRLYGSLLTGKSHAETAFINARLKAVSKNIKAIFIPQTLWDLCALVGLYEINDINLSTFEGRQNITNQIFKTLKGKYGKLNREVVNFTKESNNDFLARTMVLRFGAKQKSSNYFNDQVKDIFVEEIQLVKSGRSPLLLAILEELKSDQSNKILLYRATNGVKLNFQSGIFALDFVVPAAKDSAKDSISVSSALDNLAQLVNKNTPASLDLSYQYSLLGGCSADPGICPYYYYSSLNTKILYVLSLTRSFAQQRAKQLIFMPSIDPASLVEKELILSHPRFRLVGAFRFPSDQYLGGEAFKLGYYRPLNLEIIKNITVPANQKYLSFLLELSQILSKNSVVIGINPNVSNNQVFTPTSLQEGQKEALDMLEQSIRKF